MIAPSLLSADFTRLAEELEAVESAGADMLHLDVMDGHFVPNITFGPMVISQLRNVTKLPFDTHLMIENPDKYLDDFIKAGSDILTIHLEAANHIHKSLTYIRAKGVKAGVSINPGTPLCLLDAVLEIVDLILIMSVNPGFGGQSFIDSSLKKIDSLKKIIVKKRLDTLIEVDGGINDKVSPLVWDAGADILVAGSYIFNSSSYSDSINKIRR